MLLCESCCCGGGCLPTATLFVLLLAEALLFCDPVTKLKREEAPFAAVLLAPLVCALFQADSGTVDMVVSVAVLGFRALLLNNDVDVAAEGTFLFCLLATLVADIVFLCVDDTVIQ